ncbi:MAG: NAD-dependent epimerase/dehydratase family protein [Candidatus Cloacimonadota bacterium]
MKIAITGANGFVGSGLIRQFQSSGHQVTAVIRKNSDTSIIPDCKMIRLDYNNSKELLEALADVDVLIHNAGMTKALNYAQIYRANVQLTRDILGASQSAPSLKQFIFISSQAASRPSHGKETISEEDPSAPVTWYGKSKLRAERVVKETSPVPFTIIRPCSIYGPGDKDFLQLAKLAAKGLNLKLGTRTRYLNMIHVNELANLLELCLLNDKAFNQTFFASDGEVYTQDTIPSLMAKALKVKKLDLVVPESLAGLAAWGGELWGQMSRRPVVLNREKIKEFMAESWLCSIDKARNLLGYNPQPNLEKCIKETIQWYKEASWL